MNKYMDEEKFIQFRDSVNPWIAPPRNKQLTPPVNINLQENSKLQYDADHIKRLKYDTEYRKMYGTPSENEYYKKFD